AAQALRAGRLRLLDHALVQAHQALPVRLSGEEGICLLEEPLLDRVRRPRSSEETSQPLYSSRCVGRAQQHAAQLGQPQGLRAEPSPDDRFHSLAQRPHQSQIQLLAESREQWAGIAAPGCLDLTTGTIVVPVQPGHSRYGMVFHDETSSGRATLTLLLYCEGLALSAPFKIRGGHWVFCKRSQRQGKGPGPRKRAGSRR